jgi:hypothetical protein
MNVMTAPTAFLVRPPQPPQGLAAIPDSWLAQGESRGYVTSPYGADYTDTTRTRSRVNIDCDSFLSPDIQLTDLGNGRIEIFVDMPFPLPNIKARGRAEFRDEKVTFVEENGPRRGEITRRWSGTLDIVLREAGKEDMVLSYMPLQAIEEESGCLIL